MRGTCLPPCDKQADSDSCGHFILATARLHRDALLSTNMRTVSGVSGSDSVFAEDSCLQWCVAVTLSERVFPDVSTDIQGVKNNTASHPNKTRIVKQMLQSDTLTVLLFP